MIEVKLGVENRYSIMTMLDIFHFIKDKSKDPKVYKKYLKDIKMSLSIMERLEFTADDKDRYKIIENDETGDFTFNTGNNSYETFIFSVDELKFIFDNVFSHVRSVFDYNTLEIIFKEIKDEYSFDDVKEFSFTNYTELENVKYILLSNVGVSDVYFDIKKPTKWINEFINKYNVKTTTIKNMIMLYTYLTLDNDLFDEYGVKLVEKDGKFFYETPEDFVFEANVPTKILNEIESDLTEIGIDLNTYVALNKILGFFDEDSEQDKKD